jgi:chromate transporter
VLAIMALSLVYAAFGNVGLVQALFFGLKAAVLAVVLEAVVRIGRRALKNNVMVALAALAFVAIFFFGVPFPLIILAAALIGYLGGRAGHPAFLAGGGGHGPAAGEAVADAETALGEGLPDHARPPLAWSLKVAAVCLVLWLGPVLLLLLTLGSGHVFTDIATFFSKMAVVTFGGAYAVLAYVAQEAVETYGWLRPGEMLDGLGMAETTPGPLIMVVQFVGFMGAFRDPGALPPAPGGRPGRPADHLGDLRAVLPVDLPRRAVRRDPARRQGALRRAGDDHRGGGGRGPQPRGLVRAARAVRRGARGRVLGLTLDVPTLSSVNLASLALTAAALVAVFRFKAGMIPVLAACSAAGVLLYLVTGVTA